MRVAISLVAARTYLALVPLYQGQFEEALRVLDDGITTDKMDYIQTAKTSLLKYVIMANIYSELGNYQEARSVLNRAIEIQEKISYGISFDYRPLQSYLYGIEGNLEMAEKIADDPQIRDNEANRNSYWKVMARAEYFKGRFDESIGWLSKLRLEGIIDFDDNSLLGRAYMESGKYNEAAEVFESMLTDYFNRWRLIYGIRAVKAHYYLGSAYDNMGEFEKALQQYELFTEYWQDSEPISTSVKHALERLAYLRKHI